MTRDVFASMLQTLGQAWTDRDYEKAISFFTDGVRCVFTADTAFETP
jgi:hypothetical protein